MEGHLRGEQGVGAGQDLGEGLGLDEAAVGHRVQVGEVDDRPHPGELLADGENVVGVAEFPYAPHHLEAEGDRAPLGGQALAQFAQLLDDVGQGPGALPPQQEAGVQHHRFGAGEPGEAGGVVEHADGPYVLRPAVEVAEEGGQGGVHRESDAGVGGQSAQSDGARLLQPEAALEVELEGRVPAGHEEADGLVGVVAGGPVRSDTGGAHAHMMLGGAGGETLGGGRVGGRLAGSPPTGTISSRCPLARTTPADRRW